MDIVVYLVALFCVVGVICGQLLLKLCANFISCLGYFHIKAISIFCIAILIYGVTTILWVWVLQKMPLGRAYSLMALAFVLTPLISHLIFKEPLNLLYFIGIILIVLGIGVIHSS